VLRQIYDQMPEPKWVLSMGVCASSGGMFNNYAIVQGVDHVVPVDMYLPGCPPRPEMLIDAILKLHEKVMAEPLGDRRAKTIADRAAEGRGPIVKPGSMPSSYRYDKQRRAEWEKAVVAGTEEQLRISNWVERSVAVGARSDASSTAASTAAAGCSASAAAVTRRASAGSSAGHGCPRRSAGR